MVGSASRLSRRRAGVGQKSQENQHLEPRTRLSRDPREVGPTAAASGAARSPPSPPASGSATQSRSPRSARATSPASFFGATRCKPSCTLAVVLRRERPVGTNDDRLRTVVSTPPLEHGAPAPRLSTSPAIPFSLRRIRRGCVPRGAGALARLRPYRRAPAAPHRVGLRRAPSLVALFFSADGQHGTQTVILLAGGPFLASSPGSFLASVEAQARTLAQSGRRLRTPCSRAAISQA
jgi:hypothetical protein